MSVYVWLHFAFYLIVLVALAKPLGKYMARVFDGEPTFLDRVLGPVESAIYRWAGIDPATPMRWQTYAGAMLLFNLIGLLAVYALQRTQHLIGLLNPQNLPGVSADSSFNTAVSFATNTNWQGYGGETTMSYLTQMLGLSVQNFVSAAAGLAVFAALVRGFRSHPNLEVHKDHHGARADEHQAAAGEGLIGNFWVDLTRSTLYILLPLSIVLAIALASQGVVQNFDPYVTATLAQSTTDATGATVTEQILPMGPAASQVAIKQLGTNGGGFFNVNSAHPYENPTLWSDLLESLSILVISGALCHTLGVMVGDTRQGWALLTAMLLVFVPLLVVCGWSEEQGNPALTALGVDQKPSAVQSGGNMEGKEARFGIARSTLWATATTAASNGSVNSMHDSYTPLGGLVPMWLMQTQEIIFGGVGSGLYGMIVFALITVFVAGLMVGRTPEYLGKKIEAYEMKMAALVILFPPLVVLLGAAIAVVGPGLNFTDPATGEIKGMLSNPGAHGFSEVLYAFSSAGNNNGSAFAGLNANNVFYNTALGLAMLVARYWVAIPTLAIAGSLAAKKLTPPTAGTLPTHGPLFVILLATMVIVVGALTFIPALALGPIVEQLQMVTR
ncbi:MAG TPA: potassium-transporting ATPase subunit KdpA [Pirellulales bacterium]|nr:potassium-transporting ATPase subunit KdpA [Pirellulales bacterium]